MRIKTYGSAVFGVNAATITIEVNVDRGAQLAIVGLPDKAVAESKERVRAAISSTGLSWPYKKITVNLAPADVQKEGSHFDLAIALAI